MHRPIGCRAEYFWNETLTKTSLGMPHRYCFKKKLCFIMKSLLFMKSLLQAVTARTCSLEKTALMFLVFVAELHLRFLYSAQNCTYIFCVGRRTALTKTMVWTKCPLQKLWFGENCPYVSCIRRRIALTFSVFGAELHLHFLCSAQNRPYKNNGLCSAAVEQDLGPGVLFYEGNLWSQGRVAGFGAEAGRCFYIHCRCEPKGETGEGIHVQTVWCGVHRAQSPSHGRCLVHSP